MVTAHKHYPPFGMLMPGRSYTTGNAYRFGFNGKENDDEVKGEHNSLDFGDRIYDSRLNRWLSIDHMQTNYPDKSPFSFCFNNPLKFIDPDGQKVYMVISIMEFRETDKGEVELYEVGKAVIDVTNPKDIQRIYSEGNPNDIKMYEAYLNAKKTEIGKQELECYETSESEDIYFTHGVIVENLMQLPYETHGLTLYNVQDKNQDGTFVSLTDIDPKPSEIIQGLDFTPFDGTKLRENVNSSFVLLDELLIDKPKLFNEDEKGQKVSNGGLKKQSLTIIHEVIAHITYALQGIELEKQHDVWYGKKGGSESNYAPNSDHDRTKKQVETGLDK